MIRFIEGPEDPQWRAFLKQQGKAIYPVWMNDHWGVFGLQAGFWILLGEKGVQGIVYGSPFEMVLYAPDPIGVALDEVAAFVRHTFVAGAFYGNARLVSRLAPYLEQAGLPIRHSLSGPTLRYEKTNPPVFPRAFPLQGDEGLDYHALYTLLFCSGLDSVQSIPFEEWYVTLSYKLRHHLAEVLVCKDPSGGYAGAGMIYGYAGGDGGILGAVATKKEWRGKGIASTIAGALTERLISLGKVPMLFASGEKSARIYERLGYERDGIWQQISFKKEQI